VNPPIFCAVTEMAWDVLKVMVAEGKESLDPHPFENLILLPSKWPEKDLNLTGEKHLHVMEVFVDYFCTMVQTKTKENLLHVLWSLLYSIDTLFSPPAALGLKGVDPIFL